MSFSVTATRTPNTVLLKGDIGQRYKERAAGATITPGMLIEDYLDTTEKVRPHSVALGRWGGLIAHENSLVGATSGNTTSGNTISDNYSSGEMVRCVGLYQGDVFYGILKAGQSVTNQDWVASNGDGKLCKAPSEIIANNVADGATLTSWTASVAMGSGTATIPANTLKVGDVIRIRVRVAIPSTNGADTMTPALKLNTTSLIAAAALNVTNDDTVEIDFSVKVRAIGAVGAIVGHGSILFGPLATAIYVPGDLNTTALDTTAAVSITMNMAASASSPNNQAILREFQVWHYSGTTNVQGGQHIFLVGQTETTSDLSLSADDGRIRVKKGF